MMEEQQITKLSRLKRFYAECVRVLTITKKPNAVEYKTILKVSGIGIALIGMVGFIVTMIRQFIFG